MAKKTVKLELTGIEVDIIRDALEESADQIENAYCGSDIARKENAECLESIRAILHQISLLKA